MGLMYLGLAHQPRIRSGWRAASIRVSDGRDRVFLVGDGPVGERPAGRVPLEDFQAREVRIWIGCGLAAWTAHGRHGSRVGGVPARRRPDDRRLARSCVKGRLI
jgi:hypothetical protein